MAPTRVVLGSLDIRATPDQVAPARHWLHDLLTLDHETIADDVVLMACEVVTNSIRHSDSVGSAADGTPGIVSLLVLNTGDALRVEVSDAGSRDTAPQIADDGPDALNGRGLYMLDVLSAGRWGSYAHADGRTVWFAVAIGEQSATDSGRP